MAAPVLMPQVGISVESCIITEWLKKKGDQINVGDILFTYETDKSSLECESTEAGELLEIFYGNGEEVVVLKPVCVIGKAGEDVSKFRPERSSGGEASATKPEAKEETEQSTVISAPITVNTDENVKISPRAKNLAESKYVDITLAQSTGPYGRIIEQDIKHMIDNKIGLTTGAAYPLGAGTASGTGIGGRVTLGDLANAPATAAKVYEQTEEEFHDVAFSGIRKAIAKGMTKSVIEIPQLTHNFSFDATDIMEYRGKIKANAEVLGLPNITLNDFIIYGVSRLILKYPALNAHMLDDNHIRYFNDVHLGLAVDTPRGLMVPVIKYANRKSLAEISAEVKDIATQAQSGAISPDLLTGATFTISNLGTVGVESFSPLINPPETGILGVCNITKRVKEDGEDIILYPSMGLSLTYDHRAIDGAPASRFVNELCKLLENFTVLLAR